MPLELEKRGNVVVINNEGYKFALGIPSRHRQNLIVQSPFLPIANVYVREDEFDVYAKHFLDNHVEVGALHAHNEPAYMNYGTKVLFDPDNEHFYFTIDDDLHGLRNMFTRIVARMPVRELQKIVDIWTRDYIIAADIPTGLFIYSNARTPKERSSFYPFSVRNWGPGAMMGILDPTIEVDVNVMDKFDIDYCLQMIAKWKVIWQDNRYTFWSTIAERPPGGFGELRVEAGQTRAIAYLQRKWASRSSRPIRSCSAAS